MLKYILTLVLTISLDQFSKQWVLGNIGLHNTLALIKTKFIGLNLFLTYNTGIAFGLFDKSTGWENHFFSLLTIIAIIIMVYLFFKEMNTTNNKLMKISLLLMITGALGNFTDRIIHSHVIDFIDLYLVFNKKYFHWYTFNLADSFICLGTILLIYRELKCNINVKTND